MQENTFQEIESQKQAKSIIENAQQIRKKFKLVDRLSKSKQARKQRLTTNTLPATQKLIQSAGCGTNSGHKLSASNEQE